eukprot:TRINITY_DN14746_c0_g2_i4.p3 TRINITY_DN14746_c0_g2~~TRINITY_DN14746_c0_g2_i4.p3  ORF type:complete len:162 (+),score=12.83 TRINITY_DN14746_c0_g2_i4:348-833(+)
MVLYAGHTETVLMETQEAAFVIALPLPRWGTGLALAVWTVLLGTGEWSAVNCAQECQDRCVRDTALAVTVSKALDCVPVIMGMQGLLVRPFALEGYHIRAPCMVPASLQLLPVYAVRQRHLVIGTALRVINAHTAGLESIALSNVQVILPRCSLAVILGIA